MNANATNQSGARMSPVSQAVLFYVYDHPDCTLQALQTLFCPDSPSGKGSATEQLRARLAYLVSVGHLKRTEVDGVRGYRIGSGVRPPKPVRAADAGDVPQHTPAAQYDIRQGVYLPEAGPPLRPGALDFKAFASVGYRC